MWRGCLWAIVQLRLLQIATGRPEVQVSQSAAIKAIEEIVQGFIDQPPGAHSNTGTQFFKGRYSCPNGLGNYVPPFLGEVIKSIFSESPVIADFVEGTSGRHTGNTVDKCEQGLQRQAWIPSMDILPYARGNNSALQTLQCSPRVQSRMRVLFSLGADYLMGRVFLASFSFHQLNVVRPTRVLLKSAGVVNDRLDRIDKSAVWLSLHIRHFKTGWVENQSGERLVQAFWKSALELLGLVVPCVVLLASDHMDVSMTFLKPRLTERGCTLVTSDLDARASDYRGDEDHGDRNGLAILQDLYLLSHGDHFLGTRGSTYSYLGATLVAANNPSAKILRCRPYLEKSWMESRGGGEPEGCYPSPLHNTMDALQPFAYSPQKYVPPQLHSTIDVVPSFAYALEDKAWIKKVQEGCQANKLRGSMLSPECCHFALEAILKQEETLR